jgi:AraC-like DNA-binding protein
VTRPKRLGTSTYMDESADLRVFRHAIAAPLDLHWHEFYELGLVIDGCGSESFNGDTRTIAPGTAFLLTPADFHAITPEAGSTIRLWNCIFTGDLVGSETSALAFGPRRPRRWTVSDPTARTGIENQFGRLEEETRLMRAGWRIIARGVLETILVDLARTEGSLEEPEEPSTGDAIARSITYLRHHYRSPIRLQDAADRAHLSPAYFSELFRQRTGSTFSDYLRALRVDLAKNLLSATDMSVTEICFACGFQELGTFERAFRRVTGASPSTYRSASNRTGG